MEFNLFEKKFYQLILSYIHLSKNWRAFALTCKFFLSLCKDETPKRKMEFRVSISEWMGGCTIQYIHIHAPSR